MGMSLFGYRERGPVGSRTCLRTRMGSLILGTEFPDFILVGTEEGLFLGGERPGSGGGGFSSAFLHIFHNGLDHFSG